MIDDTELHDFRGALKEHGYSEDDFELSSQQDPLPAGAIAPIKGRVTVKRKQTGVERTYEAGHGTAWVAAFATDLATNRFA